MQLHDLGAVHQAAARESHHLGLLLAPVRQRGRPLLGAPQLVRLVAGLDDAAVDEAGADGRKRAGRDGHHGFVQEPKAGVDPPQGNERASLVHQGEGEKIRVAEALGDLGRLARGRMRGFEITGLLVLEGADQDQVAALDGITSGALHESLRAADPARGGADLPAQGEGETEPESAPSCPQRLPVVDMPLVRALERSQIPVVAAEQDRRSRAVEVVRSERPLRVGPFQLLVCFAQARHSYEACPLSALVAGLAA